MASRSKNLMSNWHRRLHGRHGKCNLGCHCHNRLLSPEVDSSGDTPKRLSGGTLSVSRRHCYRVWNRAASWKSGQIAGYPNFIHSAASTIAALCLCAPCILWKHALCYSPTEDLASEYSEPEETASRNISHKLHRKVCWSHWERRSVFLLKVLILVRSTARTTHMHTRPNCVFNR